MQYIRDLRERLLPETGSSLSRKSLSINHLCSTDKCVPPPVSEGWGDLPACGGHFGDSARFARAISIPRRGALTKQNSAVGPSGLQAVSLSSILKASFQSGRKAKQPVAIATS